MATTGSVRYRRNMKRGVPYPSFQAQIWHPGYHRQIREEFSINKFGATEAKKLATEALNDLRMQIMSDGHDVNFDDLNNPPRTNFLL